MPIETLSAGIVHSSQFRPRLHEHISLRDSLPRILHDDAKRTTTALVGVCVCSPVIVGLGGVGVGNKLTRYGEQDLHFLTAAYLVRAYSRSAVLG